MSKHWIIGLGLCALLAGVIAFGGMNFWVEAAAPTVAAKPVMQDVDVTGIVPHKAIYRIEMVEKRSGAQVLNISGEMYFEWRPVCEAWTTDHRFNLLYEYADSPQMRITSDFTTYEKINGESFDFNSRRRRDGEIYEELRGRATMKNDGGQAVFSIPDTLLFDLPPGALFPMGHTVAVLNAAKAGKKFLNATIFDGSDEEGPTEVNAFIGKNVNAMARIVPAPAINAALVNTPAWGVRLAFFPLNSAEEDSDYEMDVVMHENGVISDMYVEYKDFSVTQKLIALERVQGESCGKNPPVKAN
ncbi:MAG: cell envelope integrity EipB family protein [Micavibrio sp.]